MGWLATTPTAWPLPVVQDVLDHLVHVVRLVVGVRDEGVQRPVVLGGGREVGVLGEGGRLGEVVGGEVGQEGLHVFDGVLLVPGHVVGHAGAGVVGARPAQLLEADVLARHRLDHVGSGDEHVRGLIDHHREVGDGGGVDRAARAGADDEGDLRDDARGVDVAAEDLGEEAERRDALLDAGAAAVVDADDRAAGLQREVHDLHDLLAVHLAERAAEDREVLRVDADGAAVHGAVAGDDAVAVRAGGVDAEAGRAVPRELVELGERPLVDEQIDPLPGRQLPLGVLLGHRPRRSGVRGLLRPPPEVGDLACGGVDVGFRHGPRLLLVLGDLR
jgi:hypothetical protein